MKDTNPVSHPRPGLLLGAPYPLAGPTSVSRRATTPREPDEYREGEEILLRCRVERPDKEGNVQFRVLRQQGRPLPMGKSNADAERGGGTASAAQNEDLIASLAFDLRTSLNALLGFAQMLEERIGKGAGHTEQRYLAGIGKAAARLMRSIEIVHRIARLEAGTAELVPDRVDLSDLFTTQFKRCREEADSKGVALRLLMATDRIFVLTDREYLEEAIGLVFDHAIAFTKRGSIVVRLYETREGDVCAGITVAGMVLPDHSPLAQRSSPEAEKPDAPLLSRSLGFSLFTRSLAAISVEAHVRSRKGEGSTFTLRFDADRAFACPAQ
jgi:signal transduction histidine kinase